LPSTAALQVALGNGGEPMTTITSAHGFNPNLVGVYQNVSIPLSEFNRTTSTFVAAYIYISGTGIGYFIDNIQLQSGIGTGSGNNYLQDVFRKPGTDSVFKVINGVAIFAYRDSTGTGGGGSLPTQSGNTGKYLTTNGTTASWDYANSVQTFSGGGTFNLSGVNYVWQNITGTGTTVLTLPTAVGNGGRMYGAKNTGGGALSFATVSSQTIDGQPTLPVTDSLGYALVQSNGANWIILSKSVKNDSIQVKGSLKVIHSLITGKDTLTNDTASLTKDGIVLKEDFAKIGRNLFDTDGTQKDAARNYIIGYTGGSRSLTIGNANNSDRVKATFSNNTSTHSGSITFQATDSTSGRTSTVTINPGNGTINSAPGNNLVHSLMDDSLVISFTSLTKHHYTFGKDSFLIKNLANAVGTKAVRYDPVTGRFTYADTTLSGGSQTPWTSNINGAQYELNNTLKVEVKKVVASSNENFALRSGEWDNSGVWTLGGGCTILADQALDVAGNNTMELLTADPGGAGGGIFQIVNGLTASTTYYLSFDVKRGTNTTAEYFISDWGGSYATIVNYTSYYSSTSTTVSRVEFAFTTPVGTTSIKVVPYHANFSTGNVYLGRMMIARTAGATYQATTTTAVTGTVGSTKNILVTDTTGISTVTMPGTADIGHLKGNTATPTIVAGLGAGTTVVSISIAGSDMGGYISITPGTSAAANGTVATVTFNKVYTSTPTAIILMPANAAAAALSGAGQIYVDQASITTGVFVIKSNTTGLGTVAYQWFYTVIQ